MPAWLTAPFPTIFYLTVSHGDDAVAHDERGIIPRALEDLFGLISKATAEPQAPTFAVRVAFVEVCMQCNHSTPCLAITTLSENRLSLITHTCSSPYL